MESHFNILEGKTLLLLNSKLIRDNHSLAQRASHNPSPTINFDNFIIVDNIIDKAIIKNVYLKNELA